MATPLMLVTNAGLAAASVASPTGPFIDIVEFRVGDGYGYTPTRGDTGLNGNQVYVGAPSAYRNVGDNTMDIICQIPPDAGPFQYGEVALYLQDINGNKVMFSKAVFNELQTKESALGTNVAASETFHCLIKLEQSIAIFKFSMTPIQAVVEVDLWSDVVPPDLSANPDTPLTLVLELDGARASSLLHRSDGAKWTVGTTYEPYVSTTIVNATTTSVTVPAASFKASDLTSINRKYVLEFASGYFRSCASFVQSGANYVFNLNPNPLIDLPAVGSALRVYESVYYRDNSLPIGNATTMGIVRAGNGIAVPSNGVFETYGLLHGVPGSGRTLTSADDLNSAAINSGEYSFFFDSRPGNLPAQLSVSGGRVRVSNYQGFITQQVFPQPLDPNGSDTDPNNQMWWRIGYENLTWSAWRKAGAAGIEGGGLTFIGTFAAGATATGVFDEIGAIMAFNSGSDPAIFGYLNGTQVTGGDSNSGTEGVTVVGYKGSTWSCRAQRRTMTVYKVTLTTST